MSNQMAVQKNPFTPTTQNNTAQSLMSNTAGARSASEVQMQVLLARQFPRDGHQAFTRIMQACQRPMLAEQAEYNFPRGGETVSGPSIRLAETIAQCWGNIEFGVRELSRANGESVVESFCWDLETNVRQSKTFAVPHQRSSRSRGVYEVTDPRDIYELTANQAARRLRACILGVIPGDVVDAALVACRETRIAGVKSTPVEDRTRKLTVSFAELGITADALREYLGHDLGATTPEEIDELRGVYQSIKDNYSSRADYFPGQFGGRASGKVKASELSAAVEAAPIGAAAFNKAKSWQPEPVKAAPVEPVQQPITMPAQPATPAPGGQSAGTDGAADHSGHSAWVKGKKRLAALIGHAGASDEVREAFYAVVCSNHGADGLEQLTPANLEAAADALAEFGATPGDDGAPSRAQYVADIASGALDY